MDAFNEGIILPTLIKQLKNILARYPDDGQILKEIIQNAEDAGASKVIFLIDNLTYGIDPTKLYHEGLAQYQGPALYAYNDAVFSEDDWKGIRMFHDSVKANDPMKVGRFGLGFKSVFHMTDLPSVFSGKGIGFLDPHREFFEIQLPGYRSKDKTTTHRWLLDRDKEEINRLQHQFEPFLQPLFGVSQSTFDAGDFRGTIFRFPLRSKDMKSSDISKTTYDQEKVKDLVKSLRADARHVLLFLRNLRSIEVFEKTSSADRPKKLLDIRIAAPFLDTVRINCAEFQEQIDCEWRNRNAVSAIYPVAFSVEDKMDKRASKQKDTFTWIVAQYYGGEEESRHITDSIDRTYLPFVGVAVQVDARGNKDLWKTNPAGHVFCFLPLPLEKKSPTGLRFHVHGSFAIDENRRHIKWPSADLDMARVKDNALVWNKFLVNSVLPNAVYRMIEYLTRLKAQSIPEELRDMLQKAECKNPEFTASLVYSMMPEDALVTTQWKDLSTGIYAIAFKLHLFYSPVSGGRWLHYEDAIFDCSGDKGTLGKLIRRILYADQKNLVSVPQHIHDQLPKDSRHISASIVCESLKNTQHDVELTDKERTALLNYFSEELSEPTSLIRLELMPLSNDSWTTFKDSSSGETVYICSSDHPKDLLPGMEHRILKTDDVPQCVNDWAEKGLFQMRHLNAQDVSELIRIIFERWHSDDQLRFGTESWLTERWLSNLWSYLGKYFNQDLSAFENIHIVPVGDGTIVKLSQHLPIISKIDGFDKGSSRLNADLINLCRHVGIQVIENLEQEVLNHHSVWNTYILQPNTRGLLSAMQRLEVQIKTQNLVERFKTVPEKSRQRFNEFVAAWISSGQCTPDYSKLIRSLPIFCTVDGSGLQRATHVSLENVQLAAPLEIKDLPLPCPKMLLDFSVKNSRQIGAHLGVRLSSIPDLLVNIYFPAVHAGHYSTSDLSKLMQYVCKNIMQFEQVNCNIISHAKEIHFIKSKGNSLVKPSDVYEKSELLSRLFDEKDVFPCGEFSKPSYNQTLLKLGMKKSNAVTACEVLAIAEKLSNCSNPKITNMKQSEALIKLLNQRGDHLLSQTIAIDTMRMTLKDKLTGLKWVKISSSRPESNYPRALSFFGEQSANNLARPSEISSFSHVYVIGSSRAVINIEGIASLAKKFGWTDEPPVQFVVQHLLSAISCYKPQQKLSAQYVVQEIYKFLSQSKYLPLAIEMLRDKEWIWHGDGFAKIEQTVLRRNQVLDLRPYIYPIPVEMAEFKHMWSACNLKENCSLLEVLIAIKEAHGGKTDNSNKEHNLKLTISILNEIAKGTINDDLRDKIVVPISREDGEFEMRTIDECAYCDKEWYQHGFSVEDLDKDIYLIHELVPLSTAEKLKIPSLISKTLGAEELDIGYGQSEPLTRRLKDILRDYTDGMAVLKELIQNADDAGATEIRFLYDERRNEDAQTILLDPGMKGLQGPALCVFNDAVFTDDDLKNIVELSKASKESITEKIGRFGLGFNAVYNLTDVPIFISREFIVFFDPHTSYLGKAIPDKRKPGIRLNLRSNRKKIQRLVDQFKPLNGIFQCDLGNESSMESYNGTLFRFPLRTKEQAIRSEICQISYTGEEIVVLLKLLHNAGHDLLMYTQNIQKITVYHLSESASTPKDMQEWYTIKKDLVKVLRSNGCIRQKSSPIQTQCAVLEQATAILKDHRANSQKPTFQASSVMKFTTTRDASILTNFGTPSSSDVSHWLIVSVLGKDKAFDMALHDKTLIPVGGVAARLQVQNGGRYQVTTVNNSGDGGGMIYCFLPLPIETIFPVHINGFFAVHSSRTHLYGTSSQDKVDRRGVWNEALLNDAITSAYCVLLEDLILLSADSDSYSIWPSHVTLKEAGSLQLLSESVYQRVCCDSNQLLVVKTKDGWTTMSQSIMISRLFQDFTIRDVAMSSLRSILRNSSEQVVDIPEKIIQTIMQTSSWNLVSKKILDKSHFYADHFLPNITSVDAKERDLLILHALADDTVVDLIIQDIDCIPVGPDGRELRPVSQLIDPSSQLAVLYDEEEGRFPKWTSGVIVDDRVLERLVTFGMKRDTLPWREILDRCTVISSNPATAAKRTPIILSLANKQLKMKFGEAEDAEAAVDKIQSMKFLPVMKKPKSFPLKWQGDGYSEIQLIAYKDGYLASEMNLSCCSCPIIDEKHSFENKNHEIKQRLKRKEMDPSVVVQQVLEVTRVGHLISGSKNSSKDHLRILNEVYDSSLEWLDDFLQRNEIDHSFMKQLASCKSIFLPSNILMEPKRCALKFPNANDTLLPYLAVVPPSMVRSYPMFLEAIGVREEFHLTDYIQILNEIKQEAGDKVLNERQLAAAIFLINHCIYGEIKHSKDLTSLKEMSMPNAEKKMSLAKDLCFNNCLWLADVGEKLKFCHKLIPHTIASELGLQTIRQGILKQHRLGLPFGQKERLVRRIQTILKEYPFTEDILKEMLQNADDAAAKEIHFICDTRTLKTEKIFEESWKPLQGPALCVYNDRSFTTSDLEGIQRLGEGGKSGDPTKTGQFGVGFNCVYHVTDVPTFLTTVENHGTVLCAFDPNCKFVPDASPADPGALFENVTSLKKDFPDVFDGYLVSQQKYDVSKTGTFFRLPLRSQETAKQSEISDKPVSLEDVKTMFTKFKSDMSEALLFVNSVERISLVEVREGRNGTATVNVSYQVTINMTEEAKRSRREFHNYVLESAALLTKKKASLRSIDSKEVSYQMEIKDSENNKDIWWIVQRFGFDDPQAVPEEIVRSVDTGDLGLLPRGGVAYLVKTTRKVQKQCRLFCFLPLPVITDLPVHLNGHFSLDNEGRRGLWKDEHKTYRAEWNRSLMEGVIAPAYTKLLCNVRDHMKQLDSYDDANIEMEKYFKLFPKVKKGDPSYINKMSKSVYAHIMSKKLNILPLQSSKKDIKAVEWLNPCGEASHKVFFDNLESQLSESDSTPNNNKNSSLVRKVLGNCGFSMFSCPVRIFKCFQKADIEVSVVSPDAVIDFFATHAKCPTRCKVGNLPGKIADTRYKDKPSLVALLEYVTNASDYKRRLDGLPFLLTADEFVWSFDSKRPTYASSFSVLAPHCPHRFIHLEIMSALKLHFISDPHLCIEFTVEEFAKTLPNLINDKKIFDPEGSYPIGSLENFLQPFEIESHYWLMTFWYFLQQFIAGTSPEHDKENIAALLSPLTNCCLLPVLENGTELLYPLGKASAVIPLQPESDGPNEEIISILHKHGVAQPNTEYIYSMPITSEIMRLTNCLFGGIQQPRSVLQALTLLIRKKSLKDQLEKWEGLSLLKYFSTNIDILKSGDDTRGTVKALPFFVDFCDRQISLEGKPVYILQTDIPNIDMDISMEKQNIIILKSDYSLKPLFEYLQCSKITIEHAYCKLIFKDFSNLSFGGQQMHMNYVGDYIRRLRNNYSEENEIKQRQFFEQIKILAFIPKVGHSQLFPPSEFYDPDNKIFKAIHKEDKFPPKPYNTREWLSILRDCGLVKDLTNEMLLSYAKMVAANAQQGVTPDLINQSNALTNHILLTASKQNIAEDFIEAIKQIKFVVPGNVTESLKKLHPQFGDRNSNNGLQFIAFQNSVLHKHQELVWTVQNLVPEWNVLHKITKVHKMLEGLGVLLDPDIMSVAVNAENLFQSFKQRSLEDKIKQVSVLEDVSIKLFEYLSKFPPSDTTVKIILSRTSCVLIKETFTLIRPNQIAVDVKSEEEIKPHLYKLPLEFGKYVSLLQDLGATQDFTAAQFAMVLEDINKESHEQELNPEDIRACCKAMKGLMARVKCGQSFSEDLFLLCQDRRIHHYSDVAFADNENDLKRITEFKRPLLIDARFLELPHSDMKESLQKLSQLKKIKFVSEIVREVVTPGQTVSCEFADKMTARLKNPTFLSGFKRIVRHCLTLPANQAKITNVDEKCTEIVRVLNRIQFLSQNRVLTHLTYEGKRIENSEKEVPFFVEDTPADGCDSLKFYIASTTLIHESDFSETLAKAINKSALELLAHSIVELSSILLRPIASIEEYLNVNNIRESETSSFCPVLGAHVPRNDQHLLIQDEFVFYPRQLVAFELDDPFDRCEQGLPTYILVEVCARLDPEDPCAPILSAKYKIRVNQEGEEKIVQASCLYAFARNKETPNVHQTAIVISTRPENSEDKNTFRQTKDSREDESKQQSLEDIVEELKTILKEAWSQSKEELNRIKKRLYLKWHPDKNQNPLSTEVCQILQHLVNLLIDGKSIDDYNKDKASPSKGKASPSKGKASGASYTHTDFDDFFHRMGERARAYNRQRENYRKFSSKRDTSGYHHSNHDYEGFFRGFTHRPNPQPEEARIWMKQAKYDLQSSQNDGTSGLMPSFDWMCFKCYEASKIAIRAVQYAKDSNKMSEFTDSLTSLSFNLNDSEISSMCRELESLIPSTSHLKYPSHHGFRKAPCDLYQEEKATKAYQLSNEIYERCSEIIEAADDESDDTPTKRRRESGADEKEQAKRRKPSTFT